MWHHRMVVTVGSLIVSEEVYKQVVEQYTDGLNLIRQEFAELEKQEREREWRRNKVEAKYFFQAIGIEVPKPKTDPPTKPD